jgi:hypothetical protein
MLMQKHFFLEKEVLAFLCSRADGKQREEVEPDTCTQHRF